MKRLLILFLFIVTIFNLKSENISFVKNIVPGKKGGFLVTIRDFFIGNSNLSFHPFSVAVLPSGYIAFSDIDNSAVVILNRKGKIEKIITKIGKIPLGTPVSIFPSKNGGIFVVDSTRKGVVLIDKSLSKAKILIVNEKARFTSICEVKDNLFLTDTVNHRVCCYSKKGDFLFSFGKRGIGKGEFNFPSAIATDGNFLYVLDTLNFRVQIFDLKGTFKKMFGKPGDGGGKFSKPKDIAIIAGKYIAISDVAFDNIQLFDKRGNFLTFFGKNGNCRECFIMPSGIFSQNKLIYICDRWNKRISVWELKEEK